MIGQRFPFLKPVELSDSIAYECYYNGPQSVTEIELEDGSVYKFTNNHKLLVLRNNIKEWIEVKDLLEDDDIVSVNDK
jgi:intein/homing endonuclease